MECSQLKNSNNYESSYTSISPTGQAEDWEVLNNVKYLMYESDSVQPGNRNHFRYFSKENLALGIRYMGDKKAGKQNMGQ